MIKNLLILLLPSVVLAGGPKYKYENPKLNDEVESVYHDIRNVLNGTIGPLTISSATISSATVSALIVSTGTFDVLSVGGSTRLGRLKQRIVHITTSQTSTTSNTFQTTASTVTFNPTNVSSTITVVACGQIDTPLGKSAIFAIGANGNSVFASSAHSVQGDSSRLYIYACTAGYYAANTISAISIQVLFRNGDNVSTVTWGGNTTTAVMIIDEYL